MIINPLRLSLNPRGIRFELALRDISQNIYLTSIYTFKNLQNVFTSSSLFHNTHLTNLTDETAQYAAYEEATQRPHEVEWTNQIIGDAAAYAAPEGYERHCEDMGKHNSGLHKTKSFLLIG